MASWTFETSLKWQGGERALESAPHRPDLNVSGPPEFGGPDGQWTPEHLMLASIEACLLMTAMYFITKGKIGLTSYESATKGILEKTANGLRYTSIQIGIRAVVAAEADRAALQKAVESAEKYCPMSAAVNVPLRVTVDAVVG